MNLFYIKLLLLIDHQEMLEILFKIKVPYSMIGSIETS